MSDTRPDEGDWGETELDAHERADAEINLDDPEAGDNEPWSPPDRQPRGGEAAEIDGEETLSQRLLQEERDPNEKVWRERRLGGDDPDSIPADDDFLGGDGEVGDELAAADEGDGPEQGAVHVVPDS